MSTMMQPPNVPAPPQGITHSRSTEDNFSKREHQKIPMFYGTSKAGRMPQVRSRARQKKTLSQTLTSRRHQGPRKSATRSLSKASSMLLAYGHFILIGMAIGIAAVACTRLIKHIQKKTPVVVQIPEYEQPTPAEVEPGEGFPPAFGPEGADLGDLRLTRWSTAPGQDERAEHILEALGGTRAVFHGRASRGTGFTPPFEADTREVFGCVNAGNGELWIGGGGINGEIAAQLLRAATERRVRTNPSRIASATAEAHTEALRRAKQQRGTLVRLDRHEQPGDSPFQTVFAYVPPAPPTWNERATGPNVAAVFIDVLDRQYTPLRNPRNAYVVYAVPPKGSAPDADFNVAYGETYNSIVAAVNLFNQSVERGRQIERLRLPLLSGGIFAGGRSPRSLGFQAMRALSSAIRREGPMPTLDFAWDTTEAFFEAARDLEQARPW